jgi:hypothetical protein
MTAICGALGILNLSDLLAGDLRTVSGALGFPLPYVNRDGRQVTSTVSSKLSLSICLPRASTTDGLLRQIFSIALPRGT